MGYIHDEEFYDFWFDGSYERDCEYEEERSLWQELRELFSRIFK